MRNLEPARCATGAPHAKASLGMLAVCMLAACVVTEPTNGSVQTPEDPVVFQGFSQLPHQRVEVRAKNAGGDFETFARTRTARKPRVLEDGSRVYPWKVEGVVPHWQGEGCDREARVRAVARLGRRTTPLFTFDAAGAECLREAMGEGKRLSAALASCAASRQRELTLRAASDTHQGDLEVLTQADADALRCVARIDGNLTLRPTAADGKWPNLSDEVTRVELPNLQEVTGELFIEVQDSFPGHGTDAEIANLPALHLVGGALRYHHVDAMNSVRVDLGMPALTHVEGDLELEMSSYTGRIRGLNALTTVGGDFHYFTYGDFYLDQALQGLSRVDGDVQVEAGLSYISGAILEGLREVGGSLELRGLGSALGILPVLQTVGGDLRLASMTWRFQDPWPHELPALVDVGGRLSLVDGSAYGLRLGGPDLAMGALEVREIGLPEFPLAHDARVAPRGTIYIQNNVICPESVDAFMQAQYDAGWSGAQYVTGNDRACDP